ncbi:MAG: 3'-5' exonuclease [Candidatus Lokiarchaeota archaeon]|nr:3'-5' exonuclease [Candidatus Lokiarchaeota archaeon]
MNEFIKEPSHRKIAIIDVETTDIKNEGCIIEIGIVELDLVTGATRILFDSLVKELPFGDIHRNAWIFNNSDLKFEDIVTAPSLDHVKSEIQDILNLYSLTAYNTAFDFGFMESRGFIIKKDIPDIMAVAKEACKIIYAKGGYKNPKMQEAWDNFFPNTNYREAHRAVDDAIHEARILFEMYRRGDYKIEL